MDLIRKIAHSEFMYHISIEELSNTELIYLISTHLFAFLVQLPGLQTTFADIQHMNITNSEKATLVLKNITEATEPIPTRCFIRALQHILSLEIKEIETKLQDSFGFFSPMFYTNCYPNFVPMIYVPTIVQSTADLRVYQVMLPSMYVGCFHF